MTADRWQFDAALADRAVGFISSLRQTKGRQFAGKKLELLTWQDDATRRIFGTIGQDGLRRYKVVYVCIPRKNGKTTWAAALALYLLVRDGEEGGEG